MPKVMTPEQIDQMLRHSPTQWPPTRAGTPAIHPENEGLLKHTAVCPECFRTLIKMRGSYHCCVCNETYLPEQAIDSYCKGAK